VKFALSCLLLLLLWSVVSQADERYMGSQVCQSCHQAEFRDWTESHHFKAMQAATANTVLGGFNNAEFNYGGLSHRFFRDGEKFMVETDNAEGELEVFEISHTFGFEPLQQYLVAFPDGRYQARQFPELEQPLRQLPFHPPGEKL
jgi:hypothetical protein